MIFIRDQFIKIWKIDVYEKYSEIRCSTSEKRQDDTYASSNWSFVRCIGKAHNQVTKMQEGDRAKIKYGKITNEMYVAKDGTKKSAFKFVITEFDTEGISNSEPKRTQTINDDEMPY